MAVTTRLRAGARSTTASKSATESRPPESAIAMRAPSAVCRASAAPTAAGSVAISPAGTPSAIAPPSADAGASTGDHHLELSIVQDLVLAHLEQRLERLLLQIA